MYSFELYQFIVEEFVFYILVGNQIINRNDKTSNLDYALFLFNFYSSKLLTLLSFSR